MVLIPGFTSNPTVSSLVAQRMKAKAGAASAPPPPPAAPTGFDLAKVEEERRKKQTRDVSSATILTSPSGVLGDPPLDRPVARSATLLG